MRRDGRRGGGSGNGGRRGGSNNDNNNNRRNNGRRGKSWNDNRRRRSGNGPHDPKASAISGNKRERIAVESGHLVLIDQFMLANPQFISRLLETIDDDPSVKDDLIRDYGGTVVEINPGTYRIQRDPFAYTIVIHPEGDTPEVKELSEVATENGGHVYIDTRCLAMVDRELLDDSGLLEKYRQLWAGGQEKACRDLLRDNGGAVRYGFRRFGDELGVYAVPEGDIVCLWPDVSEPEEALEVEAAATA